MLPLAQSPDAAAWWRPDRTEADPVAIRTRDGRFAFGGLVAFTGILLLSPQIWFPILGPPRIAFVAAGLAIGAHLFQSMERQRPAAPSFRENGIALALV